MNEIHKISEGYVRQRWDAKTGKFLGQEFVAVNEVSYEDEDGNELGGPCEPDYRPFDMVQDVGRLWPADAWQKASFKIKAEVHTDDHIYEVNFDAEPWFAQASDKEILEVAECGWGGDYPWLPSISGAPIRKLIF